MTVTGGGGARRSSGTNLPGDVILLHGFFGAPWNMLSMERFLRGHGYRPYPLWYESWASPFDRIVTRICTKVAALRLDRNRPLHFVGHSMGGLVSRAVVARLGLTPASVVMLGTPNGGSEIADYLAGNALLRPVLGKAGPALHTRERHPLLTDLAVPHYPIGIIAGDRPLMPLLTLLPEPHDGKVSVAATHLPGETDHIVLPVTHSRMPFDRRVQRQTLAFLERGRFTP